MKLAIMQPYLFPYIGYFQLISAVDAFVVYDDVNFIKQGWINRNYILVNGKKHLFTVPVNGASSFRLINQLVVGNNRDKLLKTISQSYSKAPFFNDVFPILKEIIDYCKNNLADYVANSIMKISGYIGIQRKFILSSEIEKEENYKGQDRVIHICTLMKADVYINAIGGAELYSGEEFMKRGVKLFFLKPKDIIYRQFTNEFVPNLSIIDVLMFNSRDEVKRLLHEYELIP